MQAIKIKKVGNILTARPAGMDFETYKKLRKEQNIMLHGFKNADGSHHPGRLDGVRIPAHIYHGHKSSFFPVVIE